MGLMDKMKEQAAQALTKAQQGVSQGKAKIDEAQAKHQWDGLLRNLGAAVYAEQREGGPSEAVTVALAALDAQTERIRSEQADGSPNGAEGDGPVTASGQESEQDTASADNVATDGEVTPEA
jgi:hypothetical protein